MKYGMDGYGYSSAYQRGIERNIARNAAKGKAARAKVKFNEYIADAQNAELVWKLTAAAQAEKNYGFMSKMLASLNEWGSLTEKQEAAVRKILEDRRVQAKKRVADSAMLAEQSDFIAAEGDRLDFEGQLLRKFEFNTGCNYGAGYEYGVLHGQIFQSAEGNVFVYFGKDLGFEPGQQVSMKATVKRHEIRDGVKQTIVSRPFKPQIV